MKYDYSKMFPHKSLRESQRVAIDFAIETLVTSDKRFAIVEAGTGVGKSAVGLTVARYLDSQMKQIDGFEQGSYFVTTQKILQDQYERDFGGSHGPMKSIKSSSNYTIIEWNKTMSMKT